MRSELRFAAPHEKLRRTGYIDLHCHWDNNRGSKMPLRLLRIPWPRTQSHSLQHDICMCSRGIVHVVFPEVPRVE